VNINNYIDGASGVGNTWKRVYVPFSAMNIGAGDSLMSVTIQAVSSSDLASPLLHAINGFIAGY